MENISILLCLQGNSVQFSLSPMRIFKQPVLWGLLGGKCTFDLVVGSPFHLLNRHCLMHRQLVIMERKIILLPFYQACIFEPSCEGAYNLPHSTMHIYLEVSPLVCNGIYSQIRV